MNDYGAGPTTDEADEILAAMLPGYADEKSATVEERASEFYGEQAEAFFSTPQRDLDGRTPHQALNDGDEAVVVSVLVRGLAAEVA